MEFALVRETDAGAAEPFDRRAGEQFRVGQAGSQRRLVLLLHRRRFVARPGNEEAVEPAEITGDRLLEGDALDPVDRGAVTLARLARRFDRELGSQHAEAVVHRVREVRCRVRRLARPDVRRLLEHDHATSAARQLVRDRESRETRADHAHVRVRVRRSGP